MTFHLLNYKKIIPHLRPFICAALTVGASAKPSDLVFTKFSDSDLTPSPACLAAAPTGEVYVGVDMLGSLGKGAGKGKIIRLVDTKNDGVADQHTVFTEIDNPRGLIPVGDKLFVIHTIIPSETGVLTGMNLSVLEDKNGDGVADGPPKTLIKDISVPKHNQSRGADHTTNGMRLGIDGWIYIAVGDFGFVDATGTDGKQLTLLGGGTLRVRPDGTEMEMYTYGLRNIYNFAIDPYMNIFTRDNNNDGGGWNIRFSHHIQTGKYGYPILFKNFSNEIIPALVDLGGGSGTGALFMDEPSWPDQYNRVPMMADWGRSEIFLHRVTPDGPTFTQETEGFIKLPQPTALDVDGSGRLYLASWNGAGYKGSPSRGFVERAVPQGWTYQPFPDLTALGTAALVKGLLANSATMRLSTQQELLGRADKATGNDILAIAKNSGNTLASRVAALFTYKQLLGAAANPALLELAKDTAMEEFALRALTDRLTELDNVPLEPFLKGLRSEDLRVRAAATISLGRLGKKEAAEALLAVAQPPAETLADDATPVHATANSPIIIPHLAVQALVRLKAVEACLAAIDSPSRDGALWALRLMHEPAAVDGLLKKYAEASDPGLQNQILATLARLYQREAPYDGSWWWNTRPDTRGPYYKPIKWEKSAQIETLFREVFASADKDRKEFITAISNRNRMDLQSIGKVEKGAKPEVQTIGQISIENVMIALDRMKGDPARGRAVLATQACIACHSIVDGDPPRGPDLNKVGSRLSRETIAEAILKPDAFISESWVDVTTNDGTILQGTLIEKSDTQVVVRNIAGESTTLKPADVKEIKPAASTLMTPHLLDPLTMEQFADVIAYLHSLK